MVSALYKHFELDGIIFRIIFIGTVRSIWEEVNRFFCQVKQVQKDDEYWLDLACKIDELRYDSPYLSIHQLRSYSPGIVNLSQLKSIKMD